jgi:hypothetical protein
MSLPENTASYDAKEQKMNQEDLRAFHEAQTAVCTEYTVVSAQDLYDLRDLTRFCSGTDLHDLFRQITEDGDPSPKGATFLHAGRLLKHALGVEALRRLGAPLKAQLADIMLSYGP